MRSTHTMERIEDLRGLPVLSSERERIGSVEQVYYNEDTNEPEWLAIGTGIFSNKYLTVPLRGAVVEADGVIVPFTKEQVKDSPDIVPDAISQHLEKELWSHYGQFGDWSREYGTDFNRPGSEYEQSRIRRWNWEHMTRR
jgi:hypothetical protein